MLRCEQASKEVMGGAAAHRKVTCGGWPTRAKFESCEPAGGIKHCCKPQDAHDSPGELLKDAMTG